jgi:hypothetical protein
MLKGSTLYGIKQAACGDTQAQLKAELQELQKRSDDQLQAAAVQVRAPSL